ncbi:MAG: cyanophycinase [Proteobacteria bacterium]|nr:MAG: cyanophycinase [Pseudomonadota bacterium]
MHLSGSGSLIIIGGAEDKKNDKTILKEFVRMAGGPKAQILIMTVATELPVEVGAEYIQVFKSIFDGDASVETLHIASRGEANDPESLAKIDKATGVYFTGGDQFRITRILGGTKTDMLLHDRYESGLILGGTSAGASMMSSIMIIQGPAETTAKRGMTRLGAGLEFLPGVIIDQHFAQRGRINRLLAAIAQYPHHLGIGIDENTALIVEGTRCRVVGEGSITVLDAGDACEGIGEKFETDENLAICDVRLHLLTSGHGYDLRNRTPIYANNQDEGIS